MVVNPKRLGISYTPNDEYRQHRVELELSKKAPAHDDDTSNRRARLLPPRVTGVSAFSDTTVGNITVNWSANISDLDRFEIQISDTTAFTESKTYIRKAGPDSFPAFTLTGSNFIRIRAKNSIGFGEWSKVFDAASNQAVFDHLAEGAANGTSPLQIINSFSPNPITSANTPQTYGSITYVCKGRPVIVPLTIKLGSSTIAIGETILIELLIDGVAVETFTNSLGGTASSFLNSGALPSNMFAASPSEGEHTFTFRVTITGGSGTSLTLSQIKYFIWEIRN